LWDHGSSIFERNGRDEYTKELVEKNSVLCIRRDHVWFKFGKNGNGAFHMLICLAIRECISLLGIMKHYYRKIL
jgi:hypothetical protein